MKLNIIIKKTKIQKLVTIFIIINTSMTYNLTNESIIQYFRDAMYHWIPPTIRKYKLYIISGFNLKEKKTQICYFSLIPESLTKYIINNIPNCIIIKFFLLC